MIEQLATQRQFGIFQALFSQVQALGIFIWQVQLGSSSAQLFNQWGSKRLDPGKDFGRVLQGNLLIALDSQF